MKRLRFWKLDGAGNDFVLLSEDRVPARRAPAAARRLCPRRTGVGADGLLLVRRGGPNRAPRLRYFNADGSRAFCGNGLRCAAFWMRSRGWTGPEALIDTDQGRFRAAAAGAGRMRLSMPAPKGLRRGAVLRAAGKKHEADIVDTGAPHAVIRVPPRTLERLDLGAVGPVLRFSPVLGPKGANIDFAAVRGKELALRTYERGVEGETLACGTGAVAAAVCCFGGGDGTRRAVVRTRSGARLVVRWTQAGARAADVTLEGPARVVFEGTWEGSI